MAEAAKIGMDTMKLEVERARKRRWAREKKKQEKIDLSPARNLQPKSKSFRYDNIKSARAEELLLVSILQEPGLLDQTGDLTARMFSSPLLGKVFDQFQQQHRQGLNVGIGALTDFTGEEMAHIASLTHSYQTTVDEKAFMDCLDTIRSQFQSGKVDSDADLMARQKALQQRKGMRQ